MKNILSALCAVLWLFPIQAQKSITLEDIWKKGTFRSAPFLGFQGLNDGLHYAKRVRNELLAFPYAAEKDPAVRLIADLNPDLLVVRGSKVIVEEHEFSADEQLLLLRASSEQIYRHSVRAMYYVLNPATGTITEVYPKKVMYASLSPDGSCVAFVFENNLYIHELRNGEIKQITRDGKVGSIINGAVDWVYEEEFSMSKGFEWSPDGSSIAYYRFDESAVKEFTMDMYGALYPERESWKYPKAGEDNARVDVFIYQRNNGTSVRCETGSERDQYLPRIKWTRNSQILSVQRLNRTQNHWELLYFDALTGTGKVVLEEISNTYIDIHDDLYFLNNGHQFLFTSDLSGYKHIWMYDTRKGKRTPVTQGAWDVASLDAVDEERGLVYYSSFQISPVEAHAYKIGLDGKKPICLNPEPGHHQVTILPGNKYYVDIHSTFTQPETISLVSLESQQRQVLEQNKKLRDTLAGFQFGAVRFGSIPLTSSAPLRYWMILPPNFDSTKKYPMLMHVYGGPGANTVNNKWSGSNYFWHQMLAQKGYIVVSVDNRGTGHQGAAFQKATYLQLGKLEQEDQAFAARWFARNMTFIDSGRVGIWGWSFGGYLSSLCLAKSPEVFKMAIAVAPVTNWRYYDNIYTERYLRKPQDNRGGYEQNSPINFVRNIKGSYLIVHGTADDNVHFQNTTEMVKALIEANVDFDSEIYPDKNHGIYGGNSRLHLYRRMTRFVEERL
jgi:dipeptidyl-peptidase-4